MKRLGLVSGVVSVLSVGLAGAPLETLAAKPAPGDFVVEIKVEPRGRSLQQTPSRHPASPALNKPSVPPETKAVFPTFNSPQLDHQLQLYKAYLENYGVPDILIVGSSRALQGVDPVALQDALAQQGFPNLKVFNFGINGATAQVVDWLLRQLLTPDQLPKLIVWADGSRAFNSGRSDRTFEKIIASTGHKQLMAGNRPLPPTTKETVVGQICTDLFQFSPPFQTQPSTLEPAPPASPNFQTKATTPQPTHCQKPAKLIVRRVDALAQPSDDGALHKALGLQVVNTRFQPSQYFQRYPVVPGRYDGDYRNFSLLGKQAEALERVVHFTQSRQIPLVVVNLPLTTTYLDYARTTYEQKFRARMQNLAQSRRFIFKDLVGQKQLSRNQYFADPSHLNRYGAAEIARHLSQDLVFPLSTVLPKPAAKVDGLRSSLYSVPACNTACLYLVGMLAG